MPLKIVFLRPQNVGDGQSRRKRTSAHEWVHEWAHEWTHECAHEIAYENAHDMTHEG